MASITEKIKTRVFFDNSSKTIKFSRNPGTGWTPLDLGLASHRQKFHWWAIYPFTNPNISVSGVLSNLNRDSTWTWIDDTDGGNVVDYKRSGQYMVYASRHVFTANRYTVNLTCAKLATGARKVGV